MLFRSLFLNPSLIIYPTPKHSQMGASKSKQFSQSSQTTIKDKTLSGLGNLNRLLPTGTVFLYQFLSPVLSNNGHCTTTIYKYLTAILVAVCGFSCFFSSFTDSYVGDDGKTHYGVVTSKGLWTFEDSKNVDLSVYKLRFGDFVQGASSSCWRGFWWAFHVLP